MAEGAGRYDGLCTLVRESSGAIGAVILVGPAPGGPGFSVQGTAEFMRELPRILVEAAAQIQADIDRGDYS